MVNVIIKQISFIILCSILWGFLSVSLNFDSHFRTTMSVLLGLVTGLWANILFPFPKDGSN